MQVQDLTPERLGPYRLERRLGEGGMGVVYLATDEAGQSVAVKVLRPALAADATARRRLIREVEAMRLVHSPYVAQVLAADLEGDVPYIVTQYVPGRTLDATVCEDGPLSGAVLSKVVCGLALALIAVHAAGIVHRDLKPGNVMLSDGEPVVIDFGIAQLADTTRLTMTGMFMGTPGFLAPEVIEGVPSGPASDVHSWGATVAFAATGKSPYGTGAYETIFYRIMHGQPDLDAVPLALRPLISGAMARDPAQRPSAAELVHHGAALDPAALVAPPARPAPAAVPATMAEGPGRTFRMETTRPLADSSPADLRDLLPPVAAAGSGYAGIAVQQGLDRGLSPGQTWQSGQAGQDWPAGQPWPAGLYAPPGQGPAGQLGNGRMPNDAGPRGSAGQRAADRGHSVSPWSPLVLAAVAVVAAAAVAVPLAGTVVAVAALVALHAAALCSKRSVARAAGSRARPAAALRTAAYYPVALLRGLLHLLLLSPVYLLGFAFAAAVTVVLVRNHPLPPAVAIGAGAAVALVGAGPGSSASRGALARLFGTVARRPAGTVIAYLGMTALAAGAVLAAATQQAIFWPVSNVHGLIGQLPVVHTLLAQARSGLISIAHSFGL